LDKRSLSEQDICTQFITPAIQRAGWNLAMQVRQEVTFTAGRIVVRGKLVARGRRKRADYVLYYTPNLPLAVIEAKDNTHGIGAGMQQALGYAETLDVPLTVRVFLWRFERYVAKPCVSLGREPQELQDSLL
jgi:type I restriction enzyme R subunit